jgi:hypothetical protein
MQHGKYIRHQLTRSTLFVRHITWLEAPEWARFAAAIQKLKDARQAFYALRIERAAKGAT